DPLGNRVVIEDTSKGPAQYVGMFKCQRLNKEGKVIQEETGTGVLIGPRHVLTAAHVIWDPRNKQALGKDPAHKSIRLEEEGFWHHIFFYAGCNGFKKGEEARHIAYHAVDVCMQKRYQSAKEFIDENTEWEVVNGKPEIVKFNCKVEDYYYLVDR